MFVVRGRENLRKSVILWKRPLMMMKVSVALRREIIRQQCLLPRLASYDATRKGNETCFPRLATPARCYFCIPGKLAPSERVFSASGLTVNRQSMLICCYFRVKTSRQAVRYAEENICYTGNF